MKYPIGIQAFDCLREEGYEYADKTEMIYALTHQGKVYFLGRPRRFGKSLLVSTTITWARKNCSRGLPSRNWKRNGRPTRYFTLTSEQVLT